MVTGKLKILAVVPARGGSKSIPRKNIKPLDGHPLIAYSIAAGLKSGLVDRVIVSTDDPEIARTAQRYEASVPFLRPPELAGDLTTDLPVFVHALEWLRENEGYVPDIVVQLRPTSPFRPKACVDEAIRILLGNRDADSIRAITPSGQNPYKMWHLDGVFMEPLLVSEFEEPYNMPRQALPPSFWQTGHIEVIRTDTILNRKSMTGNRILPYIIDSKYAIDLDTPLQWQYAEFMLDRGKLEIVRPDPPAGAGIKDIALAVFDFDGVFTDDHVWVNDSGRETVRCHRGDGMGIALLKEAGIPCFVLSTEKNPVVTERCSKLGIPCRQGVENKTEMMHRISEDHGITLDRMAYIGNDINDLGPMALVGWPVAVQNAHPAVLQKARWILQQPGGTGAVREFCEGLITSKEERKEELK